MTGQTCLRPSDLFPALTVTLPGGRAPRLPSALAGHSYTTGATLDIDGGYGA
jgi:hypothetical protein